VQQKRTRVRWPGELRDQLGAPLRDAPQRPARAGGNLGPVQALGVKQRQARQELGVDAVVLDVLSVIAAQVRFLLGRDDVTVAPRD